LSFRKAAFLPNESGIAIIDLSWKSQTKIVGKSFSQSQKLLPTLPFLKNWSNDWTPHPTHQNQFDKVLECLPKKWDYKSLDIIEN